MGAAPGGQRERVEQKLPGRGALPGGAERSAEVQQRARMLQPRYGGCQDRDRRGQPLRPSRTRADERVGAQGDADRAGAPNDCARLTSSAAKARASSWWPRSASERAAAERHGIMAHG
jgi:hypothetical protein